MKKILLATTLLASPALAADLPQKAPVLPAYTPCTVTACTGFYGGFHIAGGGTSADIVGSGINGSIFSNGVGLGGDIGYQFWNGQFFLGAELSGTYYAGTNSTISNIAGVNTNWSVDYVGKAGYGLQGLFNSAPSPANGPISPIQALNGAMMSPFLIVGGRQREHLSGFLAGAGIEYSLGGHSAVSVEYRHISYNKGVDAAGIPINVGQEQEVLAKYLYKF